MQICICVELSSGFSLLTALVQVSRTCFVGCQGQPSKTENEFCENEPVRLHPTSKSMSSQITSDIGDVHSTEAD